MKTISIVGGGFSGTMAAVNLVRLASSPLKILLINSGRPTGRGAAYSTRCSEHLLNVAARNMSALPDHPSHFVNWLKSRSEYSDVPEQTLREMFIPRRIYGDYLQHFVMGYFYPLDDHHPAIVELIEDEVVDLIKEHEGTPRLLLAGGEELQTDQVLLATGNPPPMVMQGELGPFEHPRYISDPWGRWENSLPDSGEDVVLLGTGLTMIDAFLSLSARGWKGRMTAVSRNGHLPLSHFQGIEYPDYLSEYSGPMTLANIARLVEHHCTTLRTMKQNGAIAVDKLRPYTQRIWQGFTIEEKREFLRTYASRWNVVRHRIAASIHQQVSQALTQGRLEIVRGTIEFLSASGSRVNTHVRTSEGTPVVLSSGLVVNCTGPQSSFLTIPSPLFQNLLRNGHVQPDELDMGLAVSEDFAVVNEAGEPSDWLFAIGPLVKGTLWESTAVPELRGQAFRIAQILLDAAAAKPIREEYIQEYCI